MKKLVMLGVIALLSACPVACTNDPTQSDEIPTSWETSTETSVLTDEEKQMVEDFSTESDSTSTVTSTSVE